LVDELKVNRVEIGKGILFDIGIFVDIMGYGYRLKYSGKRADCRPV
jgi:hypothetical protein